MRPARRFGAALILLALVAAACSSSKPRTTGAAATPVPSGGTLVFGLEQEPNCLDWLGTCATVSYGLWAANVTTMPRAFSVEKSGTAYAYKPTALLAGTPSLVTTPKQQVTYKVNRDAKWSDGEPITSKDFSFTWKLVVDGKGVSDTTGYENIESVDDSAPDTAIVTFKTPFADWRSLFGGSYGVFPQHLLAGKDRAAEMAKGYAWSGGPWKIESWQKGQQLTLVPNTAYWGDKPKLDKVKFTFIKETSAEYGAFKSGEVLGIYPQPQLDMLDLIANGTPGTRSQYETDTANAEALWLNSGKAPFDDVNVRKAVAFAIDRDAIVNRLFGKIGISKAMQTITPPMLGRFADTQAFAQYKPDPSQVEKLMTSSGYAKGGDGIWAKAGKKLAFSLKTPAGNQRRELIAQTVGAQLKAAGFEMTFDEQAPPDLIGKQLPAGDFQMLLLKHGLTTFYPDSCSLFCSRNIPSDANKGNGSNWFRVNDPKIDAAYGAVESSLDDTKAQDANRQGDEALAAGAYVLPLDSLPNLLLVNERVLGPVQDNPVMGPFWNLYAWGLKQ